MPYGALMTQDEGSVPPLHLRPTEAIARRLRDARTRRGWSARELADRCAAVGMTNLDRTTITNIEIGRRQKVSVEEVLALAYVLDIAPIHLMVPLSAMVREDPKDPQSSERESVYKITPERFAFGPAVVRAWIRGDFALPTTDPRFYYSEVPAEEWKPPARPSDEEIDERGRRTEFIRDHIEGRGETR